ncbi:hypothetical protein HYH02_006941 [Chlamydomonas schloesseri]|uniref:PKD/REJ-like domain-containing protein n=1 Tax=Chlamydomonas schloesseri TaxID=2026947 RepID=A0A836B648_9CHLO|nr:hypothetical protein HYH02_006941 [Chlamydomonas schloesseri]|eukprot:KAG2448359.1 hypothetical protein HYH02_006941 [Chlamydomonas schloesseri]
MPLHLRSDAGGILRTRGGAQRFSGSSRLGACAACDKSPRVLLSGPATIQPPPACGSQATGDEILLAADGAAFPTFDASASVDPSGRAAWADARWVLGYGEAAWPAAGRAALQAAVDRANALPTPSDRLQLALTAAEAEALPEYGGYELRLRISSWLGLQAEDSVRFRKAGSGSAGGGSLSVRVEGAREQAFSLSGELRATARHGPTSSPCQQTSGSSRLQWLWTAPSGWMGLPSSGVAGARLVLPAPVPALPGQRIFLRVTATDPQTGASAFEDIAVIAQPSQPVARLSGPSGAVAPGAVLVFNVNASYDPDAQALAAAGGAASSLGFSFSCQREDLAPCFNGPAQGAISEGGRVWTIPAGLLQAGVWHSISVNVSRNSGASEPRLQLARLCAAAACGQPHSTANDLRIRLSLDPQPRGTQVRWSSDELLSLASLPTSGDASSGTVALTIPASSLPSSSPSITVTGAVYQSDGQLLLGTVRGTWPLRAAPSCGLDATSPAACLRASLSLDIFPTAVAEVRAVGWVGSGPLVFEFGLRRSSAVDEPQQLGAAPSALLVGLPPGNVTLYGCAVDQWGARACASANVLVREPATGFGRAEAEAALAQAGSSAAALERGGDVQGAAQAALQASLLLPLVAITNGTSTLTPPVNASSVAQGAALSLLRALSAIALPRVNTSAPADPQALQVALSAIAALVSGAAREPAQPSDVGEMLGLAVDVAEQLQRSAAVSVASASQLCQIVASLSAAALASDGANASTVARAALLDRLSVASSLVAGLGRLAAPEAEQVEAGSAAGGGMWVAVSASAAAEDALGLAPMSPPPPAPALDARRLLGDAGTSHQLRGTARKLLATPPPASLAAGGISVSVIAGPAAAVATASATSSAGHSLLLGLSHLPATEAGLAAALGSALPANLVLRSGLAVVQAHWIPADAADAGGRALSAEPTPSTFSCCGSGGAGTSAGELLVHVPADAYDASLPTTCLSYDVAAGRLSGDSLTSTVAGTQQTGASYVAYDDASGRLTCRVPGNGVYLVAQARAAAAPVPVAVVDTAADQAPRDVQADAPVGGSGSTALAAGVPSTAAAAPQSSSSGGGGGLSSGAVVAIYVTLGAAAAAAIAVLGVVAYRRRRRDARSSVNPAAAEAEASRTGNRLFWWQGLVDSAARRTNSGPTAFTDLGHEIAMDQQRAAGGGDSNTDTMGQVSFLVVRESGTVESRRAIAPPPQAARSLRRQAVAASAAAAAGLPPRGPSPNARRVRRLSRDFFALPNMLFSGRSTAGTPRRNSQTAQLSGGEESELPETPPAAGGRSSGTFRIASRMLARMMASRASVTGAGADASPRAAAALGAGSSMPAPSAASGMQAPTASAPGSPLPPPLPPLSPLPSPLPPPLPELPPLEQKLLPPMPRAPTPQDSTSPMMRVDAAGSATQPRADAPRPAHVQALDPWAKRNGFDAPMTRGHE